MAKERRSNFELLRIVSMLGIVFHHFLNYSLGYNEFTYDTITPNSAFAAIFYLLGKIGVNIFVLISGYFLIESKQLKTSKILKLWLQIASYSVGIYIFFCIFEKAEFNYYSLIRQFLPINRELWWFPSTYFVMFLLSPFLNVLLKKLNQKQYIKMLAISIFLWSVLGVLDRRGLQGNILITFFVIYSIGAYIRLYKNDNKINKFKVVMILLITWLLDAFMQIFLKKEAKRIVQFNDLAILFRSQISLFTIIISVCIFMLFKNFEIKYSRSINIIGSATFGVYLIHENEYIKWLLWEKLVIGRNYINSPYLFLYGFLAAICVYIICTLIELARIYILEKNYMKLVYKAEPKINKAINKIMNPIYNKLQ